MLDLLSKGHWLDSWQENCFFLGSVFCTDSCFGICSTIVLTMWAYKRSWPFQQSANGSLLELTTHGDMHHTNHGETFFFDSCFSSPNLYKHQGLDQFRHCARVDSCGTFPHELRWKRVIFLSFLKLVLMGLLLKTNWLKFTFWK